MPAGDSAGAEARRQLTLADAHVVAAAEARATAARYSLADVTEKHTAEALPPLTAVGHHLLADRAWLGRDDEGPLRSARCPRRVPFDLGRLLQPR